MRIVTPQRMRDIEGYAINTLSIDGLLLMERAALSLAQEIRKENPHKVLCVCGLGNNGGDAWACARMLHLWGIQTHILPLAPIEKLKGDALKNARICENLHIPQVSLVAFAENYDIIVDGIFGTGLSRAPEGIFAEAIDRINASPAKVFAVDIPSGIDGQTGQVLSCAVKADVTVTFQWAKYGHYLYPAPDYVGSLVIADIGIPEPLEGFDAHILTEEEADALKPLRPRNAYKNQFGHALLCAGSRGMAGAAILAATACMRAGAGLLTVCTDETYVLPHIQSGVPAAMCTGFAALNESLTGKTAVGFGPGIGRTQTGTALLKTVLSCDLPAVIDADGLWHLANAPQLLNRSAQTVLTPHMGEMARLLGRSVHDPVADTAAYAKANSCVVLLKGACTIIASPDGRLAFNVIGTQGMATAGSGDTLTGILLALLAQGLDGFDAARLAAYLHAQAGLAAENLYGTASMTAYAMAQCVRL